MKKLLLIPLFGLLLSCNSAHNDSPLEGSWIWVASDNNELIHVYTYDGYVGIGIEMGKNRKNKMFGEMEYTSDSTAVINFTDGVKADLLFKKIDDVKPEAYYVKLVDTEGIWDRLNEPTDYKDDEKEKAFRAAMYVITSTKKEQKQQKIMSQFQSKRIVEVLRMIQDYDLVLLAFQREYIWKPEQVERLFDSLMKGYPINSILFWKVGKGIKQNYRFYKMLGLFIENNRTRNDLFDRKLKDSFCAIIDGQQRLTSLNLGLRGSYAYRKKYAWARLSENNYPTRPLYLNLSSLLTEDEGA